MRAPGKSGAPEAGLGLAEWLSASAPALDTEVLLDQLTSSWGLTGQLERLYAERDLNHRLRMPDGSQWLVKLSHPDNTRERLVLEQQLLERLSQSPGAPPVPRPLKNLDGQVLQTLPGSGHLRVLSWLPGAPFAPSAPGLASKAILRKLGETCGQLNLALAACAAQITTTGDGLATRHLRTDLPWDLSNIAHLEPLLHRQPAPDAARLGATVLDRHAAKVATPLAALERQLIHNDLNPDNVLVDRDGDSCTLAVIDFGDMVLAPVVCDLAIACAYAVGLGADAFDRPLDIIAGFHRVRPLTGPEQALLPDLVAARLCQTLLIQGARTARLASAAAGLGGPGLGKSEGLAEAPADALDTERSRREAEERLRSLRRIPVDALVERIRQVCR